MMEHKNDVLSSATQTWPKSTPPYETFKNLKQELQADAEIANAMSYMDHPTLNSSDKQVKNMMRELCDVLEELRDLGQNKKKVEPLEETFGPMTFLRRPSKAIKKEATKPVEPEEMEPKDDPSWLKALPFYILIFNNVLYLVFGAVMFRILDEKVAQFNFGVSLLIAFQFMTTIGWGGRLYMIYTTPAKIFALFYTLFGVPIVFSTFSNTCHAIGMMCWRYLPCFKEKLTRSLHNNTEIEYRLPLKLWYLILSGHYCIGVIYFGFIQYDFGLIGSVYFLTIAFATTGLGDLYPDPTVAEGIFCVIYLGLGIALVSAVFSMSAFYIQNFYFVTLKKFVKKHFGHWWIFKNRPKKE